MTLRRVAWMAGLPLIGLLIGVGVAIASSPASLNPDRHGSTGFVQPTSSPEPSQSPTVSTPGILGNAPRLITNGSNTVIGLGPNFAIGSSDAGRTWVVVRPPSNGSGLAVDPANPRHAITGGSMIQVTNDAGVTWTPTLSTPPAAGPYQPLAISLTEPNVWFLAHQGRLLRTRDGSSTWTDLGGLPSLTSPLLLSGRALGQFLLASGSQVFQLNDYGQTITPKPPLPQGPVTDLAVVGGSQATLLAKAGSRLPLVLQAATWTSITTDASGPIAGGAEGSMLVGNGGGKLGSPGVVTYSINGGANWRTANGLPFDQTVEALAGQSDSRTFYAYCYGGDIFVSSDGGRTWLLLSQKLRAG